MDVGVIPRYGLWGDISPELRSVLIESAFNKGLAGWVRRHRKIGLVDDTQTDDRWLVLPDQPYRARSALALPIITGEVLLGILTLKHSAPYHFTPEIVELMRVTATQVAMVLENACLFAKYCQDCLELFALFQTGQEEMFRLQNDS